jgi:hypothetical protein
MMLWTLALAGPALASDAAGVEVLAAQKDKSARKKDDDDDESRKYEKRKFKGWTYQPFIQPGGGLQIQTSGDDTATSVVGGADVGVKYWKKKWVGTLYLGGTYTSGSALTGFEAHLGNDFGYRDRFWGLSAGLAGVYSAYDALPAAAGLQVPVRATAGPKRIYGFLGVAPVWYFEKGRHAKDAPLGDEFTYEFGAGANLKGFHAEAAYVTTITRAGTYSTPTLSVGINP